jgi:uncharacterized protein
MNKLVKRKKYLSQLDMWREEKIIKVNIGKSGRGTEVDFVAVRDRAPEYYQVSASVLDENTLKRELAPFKQIKDNYPKYLITMDDFTGDNEGIQQVNLINWLLNH